MARASHATSFPRRVRPASAARTGWPPGFALSPRRRRQAVAARRCVDLIVPEYEAIGVVRKMSALERVADRRSRARSTTMLRRTMRSQRDAGESLCPNSRSARGGSSRRKRDGEVRGAASGADLGCATSAAFSSATRASSCVAIRASTNALLLQGLRPPRRRAWARQAASRTSPAKARGPRTSCRDVQLETSAL